MPSGESADAPPGGAPTRSVEASVQIPARPERVLRAFLDAEDLRGWWKASRSLVEPEPGGLWSVTWDDYGAERSHHVWAGRIEEIGPRHLLVTDLLMVEPERRLFGPLQIEVRAEPSAEGTLLTLQHRGYQYGEDWNWAYETVIRGWDHVLGDMQEWFGAKRADGM